jgi:DNA-directed RNA polymerase I, II, and III subunit RPABC1
MSFELIDALYRSRKTVLSLLARRGYNVVPFERFSPREVELMANAKGSLDFRAEKESEDDKQICHVLYYMTRFNRNKMMSFIDELKLSEEEISNSEFIIMLNDEVTDAHHVAALKHFITRKIRVYFFNIYRLVNNPLDHEIQPKFEVVPQEKHAKLLEALHCDSKGKLPIMRYHADVITRCLGIAPGDIIKIIRPSETIGESVVYQVVGI